MLSHLKIKLDNFNSPQNYCQAQGHSETSNVPKKQLNEN